MIKYMLVLLVLVFVLFQQSATAQENSQLADNRNISGNVVDSLSRQPVEYCTVTVYREGSTQPLTGTVTDGKGHFDISIGQAGNYRLAAYFIGYVKKTISLRIETDNQKVALSDILLTPSVKSLAEVKITGQKALIENKTDKLVYNAEKDITSQGGNATDILKKVPMVSVDVNGNVELQGSSGIMFLINGKPSTLFGSSIADALQAIPANQIQSIEVITNPGAKYDAQGTGGIINIILKQNKIKGINGNISLTTGTIMQNGSFNLNIRKGKLGINAFVNGDMRLTTTTPLSFQRTSTDSSGKTNSLLKQDGSGTFNRRTYQGGIGFDWSPNEKNIFTWGLNFSGLRNQSDNHIIQTEQTIGGFSGTFINSNSSNSTFNSYRQHSFDPSVSFKHSFSKKGHDLEVLADGSFGHTMTLAGNDQFIQPIDSLIYGTRSNNPARENEYEIKADYTQPIHESITLGLGGKFGGYDLLTAGVGLLWNPQVNDYLYNASLSNNLNYHQKVYALYSELSFPVGKSIDIRLGGRYERTQINSFYANAQQHINNGYNTVIPSVFVMKRIGDNQTIKLNYTIRINRPDYSDLNPFINTSDPRNITAGNTNLKPEIWDRYEASYNRDFGNFGSVMFTLFYRQSNGDIQPFSIYYPSIRIGDTTYTNTTVTTRENIGVEKNAGGNLYMDFHLTEKFEVRSNIIWFYRHTINQVDNGFNSSSALFRSNFNASYQISDKLSGEFFGSFNSRHREAQGYFPSFSAYSFAVRKSFWNKKGSIAISANNFFSQYVTQRTDLFGPGFTSNSIRNIPYRSIGLNFTWKFGRLEVKKDKADDSFPDLSIPQ